MYALIALVRRRRVCLLPSWTDMNHAGQALWKTLGGDEASSEEETDAPDSNDKYWQNLTQNECTAATKLGYDQSCWDEDWKT